MPSRAEVAFGLEIVTLVPPETTPDPVTAYVTIHPEDVQKIVDIGEVFTVRAMYNIGEPKILDIPFRVSARGVAGHIVPPGLDIISVNPERPNIYGFTDPNSEQNVVVTAVVRGQVPRWMQGDDENRYYVDLDIATYQRLPGEVPDEDAEGITQVSGSDGNVPNILVQKVDDGYLVTYDLPTAVTGEKIPVDAQVQAFTPTEEDDNYRGELLGEITYRDRVEENIGVFWDTLIRPLLTSLRDPLQAGLNALSDVLSPLGDADSALRPPGSSIRARINIRLKPAWKHALPRQYQQQTTYNMGDTITSYEGAEPAFYRFTTTLNVADASLSELISRGIIQEVNASDLDLDEENTDYTNDGTSFSIDWPPFEDVHGIPNTREQIVHQIPFEDRGIRYKIVAEWEQPYWLGTPNPGTDDGGSDFTNLWPQPNYSTSAAKRIDFTTDISGITRFEWRIQKTDVGTWTEWETASPIYNPINAIIMDESGEDIRQVETNAPFVEFPTERYASCYYRLRVEPFARASQIPGAISVDVETQRRTLNSGIYVMEARAVGRNGFGETLTFIIDPDNVPNREIDFG